MSARYVAERGAGSSHTAYNRRDWEVLDTERTASSRVICRANRADAAMIADALNAPVAVEMMAAAE